MKIFFKKAVCLIFAVILLLGDAFSVSTATVGTEMISGVDYSGQGTIINGRVAINNKATVSGNYVNIPIYKGKYVAGAYDYWWTKNWSGWSTYNNKKNTDFTVYNGSDKATEYDVQSRNEYQYKRKEKRNVYATKYYTQYRGNKWYNSWRTTIASSWNKSNPKARYI